MVLSKMQKITMLVKIRLRATALQKWRNDFQAVCTCTVRARSSSGDDQVARRA